MSGAMAVESLLAAIRALGFGGLLGAGAFGIVYIVVGPPHVATVTFEQFILIGGLLGAGIAHPVGKISALVFAPLASFIDHYRRKLELHVQVERRLIRPETAAFINEELAKRYFLKE